MKIFFITVLSFFSWSLASAASAKVGDDKDALRPVKLRSGPAVFHPVLERLKKGTRLSVIKEGPKWIKVRTPKGTEGWVSIRVFSVPQKPRGYGALLKERGLSGVSLALPTMACRGLNAGSTPQGGVSLLVQDFLERVPFDPGEFEGFSGKLKANGICEQLPGWLGQMAIPIDLDPGQDELARAFGMSLAVSILSDSELVTDPAVDSYVNKVGALVAAASTRYDMPWRFVVFKGEKKDAFSVPGGFVFVSSSLLRELRDEAELAGVLAHLVAHVVLGHGAPQLSRGDSVARDSQNNSGSMQDFIGKARRVIMNGATAEEEMEADAFGATYCACAGYDPGGLASVLKRVGCFDPGCKAPVKKRLALIYKVRKNTGSNPGVRLTRRFYGSVLANLSDSH